MLIKNFPVGKVFKIDGPVVVRSLPKGRIGIIAGRDVPILELDLDLDDAGMPSRPPGLVCEDEGGLDTPPASS